MDFFKRLRCTIGAASLQHEANVDVRFPRWNTLPSATNGFNPHKLDEVAQQEAKITGITHAVCVCARARVCVYMCVCFGGEGLC